MLEQVALRCLATCASSNFFHRDELDKTDHPYRQWRIDIPNCRMPYREGLGCCCREMQSYVDAGRIYTSRNYPYSGMAPMDVHDCAEGKLRIASKFHRLGHK